ncbi:ABC transporter permease [Ktedonosporobacter rubrisoli]|uniref:ABC transporter permease n=1 Tax=Ktedonosporobacter rubrisoli TaxID=2509675 RepID=A0A4P6K4D2_KTERU|nr:ABC transporter permease [Ktedonosporobacter rubrisoli]QBD82822.1 ABC transporter permease [Ktedonosporobacter rubrisoli]
MKPSPLARNVPAFLLALLLLLLWEGYVRLRQVSSLILPTPDAILAALLANWDILLGHTIQTTLETVIGILVAVALGLALALWLDLAPACRRAVYPLLIVSQTIPMIALAPLLLLWFGFGFLPKLLVVVLYCFFPIIVACLDGLESTPPELMRLLKSMHATRWQTLWLVRLPGAMPSFFSGLRIAATYSVTAAIFGEYVGAFQGLGIYMQTSANAHATVLVFAALVVTAVLSLLLFGLASLLAHLALPWQAKT